MVIRYLHLIGVPIAPDEADAPLVVNANTVLSSPIARKSLQSIPRRHPQVVDAHGVVQSHQLSLRATLDILRQLGNTLTLRYGLSFPVPVVLNYRNILVRSTSSGKYKLSLKHLSQSSRGCP